MFYSFLIIILFSLQKIITEEAKLLLVYEHFRHGARAPCNNIDENSKDIFGELWEGECEMTKIGIMQHYILGNKNRKRYQNFINENFSYYDILVYSSERDRAIQSAQAQLKGFFDNSNDIIIPVHTIDDNTNLPVFYYDIKNNCPILKEIRKKNYIDNEIVVNFVNDFIADYSKILEEISDKINININATLIDIICGAYICDYFDGRNLSYIMNKYNYNEKKFYNKCIEYNHIKHFEIALGKEANFTAILSSSLNLKNLIGYMENIINNTSKSPKYILYSGHDTTLSSIQVFFKKVFDAEIQYVPFASQMVINLIERNNGLYVLYYFNDKLLFDIPYNDFKNKILENVWERKKIEKFCEVKKKNNSFFLTLFYSSFFLFVICIIVIYHLKNNFNYGRSYVSFSKLRKNSYPENKGEIVVTK